MSLLKSAGVALDIENLKSRVDVVVKPVVEAGVALSIAKAVAEPTLLKNVPVVQIAVVEDAVKVNSHCHWVVCAVPVKTVEVIAVN